MVRGLDDTRTGKGTKTGNGYEDWGCARVIVTVVIGLSIFCDNSVTKLKLSVAVGIAKQLGVVGFGVMGIWD
jgi:hypothetical protein